MIRYGPPLSLAFVVAMLVMCAACTVDIPTSAAEYTCLKAPCVDGGNTEVDGDETGVDGDETGPDAAADSGAADSSGADAAVDTATSGVDGGSDGAGGDSGADADGQSCSAAKDCPAPPSCREALCSAGSCSLIAAPDDVSCDDGDPCTNQDRCQQGVCEAGKSTDCDDGDACTKGDKCGGGSCLSGPSLSCDDGNVCTDDSCNKAVGCVFKANTNACDDGVACTSQDTCAAKVCQGKPARTLPCCTHLGGNVAAGQCAFTDAKGREMTLIPDGDFWMGCNAAKTASCPANETPQHKVEVSGFWLDRFEVTASQYAACVAAGVCTQAGASTNCTGNVVGKGQHPINCVTWSQASAYCTWAGGLLPTEAQWEKAARGGCEFNGGKASCQAGMRTYPWGETKASCEYAVMFKDTGPAVGSGCGTATTSAVGQKPKGQAPYGSLDMAGGVLEWVRDGYDASYYGSFGALAWPANPMQSNNVSQRVLRGGSWSTAGSTLRASYRAHFVASTAFAYMGFRCARAIP